MHNTLSNPQIGCFAADILWQLASLPCLGISCATVNIDKRDLRQYTVLSHIITRQVRNNGYHSQFTASLSP